MRVFPLVLAAVAALSMSATLTACKKKHPEMTDAEKAAAVARLPAPYNTADIANGKSLFAMCRSCHTIGMDGVNMTGPALYGVFGRVAGTKEQFKYSDAVKNAGFTWDAEHLDKWLSAPRDFLPGTKMSFVGLPNPKDRIDLIGYIDVETSGGSAK